MTMKLYRVTVVLAVLLLVWTTLSAVADETNYSQCDPYCIAFLEVDDAWYAVAVDHAGRYLGLSRMTNQAIGRLLADSDMAPLMPGQPQIATLPGWLPSDPNFGFGENYSGNYAGGCEGSIMADANINDETETATHHLVLVKTTFTCSSSGATLYAEYTPIKYGNG